MNETYSVGYDGSPESWRAVMWTAARAAQTGAAVRVVSCYTMPIAPSPCMVPIPYDTAAIHAAVSDALSTAVDQARERHPGVRFEENVVAGSPRTQLVEAASSSALLVVGSTGAGAAASWLLGSVAHAVARTSDCPVVVVPAAVPDAPTNTIVVGVDGSPAATVALRWAVDEADRCAAELVVVHAWEYGYGTETSSETLRDMMRVDAALVRDAAVELCRERGRGPVRGELVEGQPAQAILDLASEADLVVVGSRGRGGFRSLLFGSVAQQVAEHATCPVVVVRPVAAEREPVRVATTHGVRS